MTTSVTAVQSDGGRQATVFCVDCADYMMKKNEHDTQGRTHWQIALKAIRQQMNFICCAADLNHMVEIIFFNTGKTNLDSQAIENVFVYRKLVDYDSSGCLKALDADAVKQIDGLIKDEGERTKFIEETLGGTGLCDYSKGLLYLIDYAFRYNGSFKKKAAVVFTRNELFDLIGKVAAAAARAERARITARGCSIAHMVLGTEELHEQWNGFEDVQHLNSVEALEVGIKRRNVALRPVSTLSLSFGNNISLAVSVYCLFREQKLETGVRLSERTNNVVRCRTRYVKQPSDSVKLSLDPTQHEEVSVAPKDIHFSNRIGGTTVHMTQAEKKKFTTVEEPGIHIIGFKPMTCLRVSEFIGPSKYLYPNETLVNGSTKMYRALHDRCLVRDVFILARMTMNRNTGPHLVAMVPQAKSEDDINVYEGFHVVQLPFADDRRDLTEKLRNKTGDLTPPQEHAAEAFVKKLTADYSPQMFSNPVLQKHYWFLEGAATDNDDYGPNHEFDQILPYFEKTTRGQGEAQTLRVLLD